MTPSPPDPLCPSLSTWRPGSFREHYLCLFEMLPGHERPEESGGAFPSLPSVPQVRVPWQQRLPWWAPPVSLALPGALGLGEVMASFLH